MKANTKSALLVTLWAIQQKSGKHYTTASWERLVELLEKYHGRSIRRRWFFYCMRDFLQAGLIARKQRYRQNDEGAISQIPSMITFTMEGLKYLVKNKVTGAFRALKNMLAWLKGTDKRFPHYEDLLPKLSIDERNDNIRRLKQLFRKTGAHF